MFPIDNKIMHSFIFTASFNIQQKTTDVKNCFRWYDRFFLYFLMSLNSKNFGFIIFENQSLRISIVNFNSTENNSEREVHFSRANIKNASMLNYHEKILCRHYRKNKQYQVNFVRKKARIRNTFIILWLINNVNWSKIYLFLMYKTLFYYILTIE